MKNGLRLAGGLLVAIGMVAAMIGVYWILFVLPFAAFIGAAVAYGLMSSDFERTGADAVERGGQISKGRAQ